MAPPRATKKSSLTTISQTATQQGAQQSRKQVVEEVEQLHEFDNANSMDVDDEIEAEEPQSQSTSDGPLEQLMAKMVDDQRKRHAAQKKGVGKAYNDNRDKVENSINTVFDKHEEEASKAHKAQLKRLQELLTQKANIEATMAKQLTSLKATYDAHSQDLQTVVDRRIKEMK